MRNLILHIGDPKTGSSSIQRALHLGLIHSPEGRMSALSTEKHGANAIFAARGFVRPDQARRQATMRRILPWLRGTDADYPVISTEFFSQSDPALVNAAFDNILLSGRRYRRGHRILSRIFGDPRRFLMARDVRVIGYARPHAGRVLSSFAEQVKCGYTLRDFDDWLPVMLRADLMQFGARFQRWREAFGDRFVLRPYIRDELVSGDVVADFCQQVLGSRNFSLGDSVAENQGLTLRSLSGLRAINRQMAANGMPVRQRIRLALLISKMLPASSGQSRLRLNRASAEQIARTCHEDARRLDRDFFGRPLFQEALEKAVEQAGGDPIRLDPDLYFSPAEQARIAGHAAALCRILDSDPEGWHSYYQQHRVSYNLGGPPHSDGSATEDHAQHLARLLG